MEKRGPSLHHLAIDVPKLEKFLLSIAGSGWLLHPNSIETIPRVRTACLARPGFPALIEVQEKKEWEDSDPFITRLELPIDASLTRMVSAIGLENIVFPTTESAAITLGSRRLLLSDLTSPERSTIVHTQSLLVPSRLEYAELWMKWRSEPNTVRYNPVAQTPLHELRNRMEKMSSDLSDLTASSEFQFFIEFEGALVGTVSLKNISHMMMYGEIGYDVSQGLQGKGIGTLAVKAFLEKIFSESPLRRIFAHVASDNLASRRLLEKLGFKQEGICREHYIINGKPTDEVLYGTLRSEWLARRLT